MHDLVRFKRSIMMLKMVAVPNALLPYAMQAEVSGLIVPGDILMCINGNRLAPPDRSSLEKLMSHTGEGKVFRILRPSSGLELDVKLDSTQKSGFVLDFAPPVRTEGVSILSYDRSRPPHPATPDLKRAVIWAFVSREVFMPLTLDQLAAESLVSVEHVREWLSQRVSSHEDLVKIEKSLLEWANQYVPQDLQERFDMESKRQEVDLGALPGMLRGRTQQKILQHAREPPAPTVAKKKSHPQRRLG
jgi:hypothetical protein